jgi:hypothetical protein
MAKFTNNLLYYGKFSGPSYSGGVQLQNGQLITNTQTQVSAVDYLEPRD